MATVNSYIIPVCLSALTSFINYCFKGFAESDVGTLSGESCAIPFTYRGTVYHSCITTWHTRPWCSTTVNYDKDKKWGDCAGGNNYVTFTFYRL